MMASAWTEMPSGQAAARASSRMKSLTLPQPPRARASCTDATATASRRGRRPALPLHLPAGGRAFEPGVAIDLACPENRLPLLDPEAAERDLECLSHNLRAGIAAVRDQLGQARKVGRLAISG